MTCLHMKSHTSRNPTVIITTAVAASTDAGLWPLSSCGGIDGLGIPSYFAAVADAGLRSRHAVVELMA